MNTMEENRNMDHGAPESAENIFALSVPKGEESFPVLKAFQEFLDAERERARRRQMTLAICFMAALVVVVVLFCGIGAVLFSGMIKRSDSKQDKLLEMLLSQRNPTPQASGVALAAPASRFESDPVIDEMVAVLKQLKADTAELKAAAAEKKAAAAVAGTVTAVEQSVPEVSETRREPPVKKTGVFSSPKRRPEVVPTPPSIETVEEEALEDAATASGAVVARPVAEKNSPVGGPVQVKVVPSRTMRLPEGHEATEIAIVTEGNVKFPWRILMPTGAEPRAVPK